MSVSIKKTGVVNVEIVSETYTGSIVTFNSQYAGLPLKSHKIALTATQSGSGTPSPDNVRTINGVSSFGVFDSDYNFIDADVYYGQYKSGDVYITTGTNLTTIRVPIGVFVGKQITFSTYLKPSSGITNVRARAWIENNNAYTNGNAISGGSEGYSSVTITPSSVFDFLNISYGSGGGNTVEVSNVQLEYGDTRTSYHAFEGTSAAIQIGSTIYGGEYDARTGVLTVTHLLVTLTGSESWTAWGSARYTYILPYVTTNSNADLNAEGSMLQPAKVGDLYGGTVTSGVGAKGTAVYISANDYSHVSDFTGMQVKYKLAYPQKIQLPPCPIDTIANSVNNIWADTGDTTLTTYTNGFNEINAVRASIAERYINSTEFIEI